MFKELFSFKYLDDLTCPVNISQKLSVLDWLLAHAVRLEYAENGLVNSLFSIILFIQVMMMMIQYWKF